MCGVVGLGKEAGEAFDRSRRVPPAIRDALRRYANDGRWRVRDAAALALQHIGDAYIRPLLEIAEQWSDGTVFEQRAAVAAVCDTRFVAVTTLGAPERIATVVERVMIAFEACEDRRRVLRPVLSYACSQPRLRRAMPETVTRWDELIATVTGVPE